MTDSPRKTLIERAFDNRIYAAESAASRTCPAERLGGTESAAQTYVDRITRSAWWARTCPPSWMGDPALMEGTRWLYRPAPPKRIWVFAKRGLRAHASTSTVVPKKGHKGKAPHIHLGTQKTAERTNSISDPWIILHEMAHVMAACHNHKYASEARPRSDLRLLPVALVRRWLGPEHARALRASYAAERVRYRLPRT